MLVTEEAVDVVTPTGLMRCVVVRPAQPGKYPSLISYSEIFQITGPIKRLATTLAGHGFFVIVPEVYHEYLPAGTVLEYTPEGATKGNALKIEKELSAYDSDVSATVDYLRASPHCNGSIGVYGLCLGGGLAIRAALHPAVSATVAWYATDLHKRTLGRGQCDDTLARAAELRGELCCIWGRQDPHVDGAGRRVFYDALAAAGVGFEWHEFAAAHAFMRDEGSAGRYNPELAALCVQLAVAFLRRRLAGYVPPPPEASAGEGV